MIGLLYRNACLTIVWKKKVAAWSYYYTMIEKTIYDRNKMRSSSPLDYQMVYSYWHTDQQRGADRHTPITLYSLHTDLIDQSYIIVWTLRFLLSFIYNTLSTHEMSVEQTEGMKEV